MAADASATSSAAGRLRSLRRLEWLVGTYTVILIAASVVMFLMSGTSRTVGDLIAAQNDAALKLWLNLDYYQHHHVKVAAADPSLPPGLFESVVEFSRTNATIVKTVHRLSMRTIFAPRSSLDTIAKHIRRTDRKPPGAGSPPYFDHFGIDPRIDTHDVVEQGMYQIELYQGIRDYAQDEAAFYKDCLGAVSAYLLPVLYALLGACLWAFRSSCQRVGAPQTDDPTPDRSSRFLMAAIAGIAISALGMVLPKDALVSPLAIAFVFGYSIEVFTSRLDSLIDGLTKRDRPDGVETAAGP